MCAWVLLSLSLPAKRLHAQGAPIDRCGSVLYATACTAASQVGEEYNPEQEVRTSDGTYLSAAADPDGGEAQLFHFQLHEHSEPLLNPVIVAQT